MIHLSYLSFLKYGFTLIGQPVELGFQVVQNKLYRLTCDNGYIYCCICYGVVYLVSFIAVYAYSSRLVKSYEDNLCLLIYGLYIIIENRVVDIPVVFPLIILLWYYLNLKPEVKIKKGVLKMSG